MKTDEQFPLQFPEKTKLLCERDVYVYTGPEEAQCQGTSLVTEGEGIPTCTFKPGKCYFLVYILTQFYSIQFYSIQKV